MVPDFGDGFVWREFRGKEYLWPSTDECLWKWVHLVDQVQEVAAYVKNFSSVIQAGGACGVWPIALAELFDSVYTFEPYPPNFKALSYNCIDCENIFAMNAALGFDRNPVYMDWQKGHEMNLGAQYAKPGGAIPNICIDDLNLHPGLIYLDLEGGEFNALKGAENTVLKCRPVIVIEDRDHCQRYGIERDDVHKWFADREYKKVSSLSRNDDAVMVPC